MLQIYTYDTNFHLLYTHTHNTTMTCTVVYGVGGGCVEPRTPHALDTMRSRFKTRTPVDGHGGHIPHDRQYKTLKNAEPE